LNNKGELMTDKYAQLEKYLRALPTSQDIVTLSFEFIEQVLNDQLPQSALQDQEWWGNQKQGTTVEASPWMDAGWLVDTVDFHKKLVRFVRQ